MEIAEATADLRKSMRRRSCNVRFERRLKVSYSIARLQTNERSIRESHQIYRIDDTVINTDIASSRDAIPTYLILSEA